MLRILFVEDHDDTRDLLCELLRSSGFDVHGVATAEEGLAVLQEGKFDVLITDHWLQGGQTGSWLANEAARQGILPATIVCSAERVLPSLPPGTAIVRKPVDVDHLLTEIARVTKGAAAQAAKAAVRAPEPPMAAPRALPRAVPPPPISTEELRADALDLVLYVTRSQCSMRGMRNLQRVLSRYPSKRIALAVVDVSAEPLDTGTNTDRIAFTPMLVKRGPGARERLVGDFQDTDALADLLLRCGLEPLEGVA
jgi:CheY-like chemotaxis protein